MDKINNYNQTRHGTDSPESAVDRYNAARQGTPNQEALRFFRDKGTGPEMFSLEAAGVILSVHGETLRRRAIDGTLRAVKVGSQWRVPACELLRIQKEGL